MSITKPLQLLFQMLIWFIRATMMKQKIWMISVILDYYLEPIRIK